MGKSLGKILGTVAPLALNYFAPGLGSTLGGALGAGAEWAPTVGKAVIGAGAGALGGGGIRGAATGAVLNGAQGAFQSGLLANTALGRLGDSASSTLGDVFGTSAKSVQGPLQPGAGSLGKAGGSGLVGAITRNVPSLGSALGSGAGGGASSYSSYIPAIAGGLNSMNANSEAQKALLKAQQQSMSVLSPYLNSGGAANQKLSDLLGISGNPTSTAEILASDPSYQFQLDEGNKALDRQQAARGNFFSGAALKAGQDYGQGLANKTVNDYYARLAAQSGAGQQAANSAGQIFSDTGSAKANAGISSANIINQTLGSLFGAGAYGRRYDQYGNLVYA